MNGAAVRRFPVAVADFGDAEATRVYLDLATGDPLLTMGHRERWGAGCSTSCTAGTCRRCCAGTSPDWRVAAAERGGHRAVRDGYRDRLSAIADEAAARRR
jgi:hypothetical protein